VAGIVDIDILKEGGVVWSDFLDSGSIPKIEKDSLASMRTSTSQLGPCPLAQRLFNHDSSSPFGTTNINDRLLKYADGKGIPNCLFLHAQNKQTVKTIIKPLRKLGIPVAGIVDIDILKEGGVVWSASDSVTTTNS
jgi:hypothetical protein